MDRLDDIALFLRVLDLGSISAAARSLDLSVALASQRLKRLEQQLGVRLLHRTTRRLTLTEAGRRYLEAAERVLADVEEADAAVSADTVEVRGTLRLNAPVSFGIREIAPLLAELAARHPARGAPRSAAAAARHPGAARPAT